MPLDPLVIALQGLLSTLLGDEAVDEVDVVEPGVVRDMAGWRAAQGSITDDGFFALRLVYTPDYWDGESTGIHTLFHFSNDARVYYDFDTATIVIDVNGHTLATGAIAFAGGTELTLEVEHTATRRRIDIRGVSSGEGEVTDTPLGRTVIESQVFVLGPPPGPEQNSTLVDLRPLSCLTFCELAQSRLLVQMAEPEDGQANLAELICDLSEQPAVYYDTAIALRDALDLTYADGAQLDLIGTVVGLGREGFEDDRYRDFLRIQVLLLLSTAREDANWTGTCENILAITRAFIGETDNDIVLTNIQPYAYQLDVPDLVFSEAELLIRFLRTATYAAVLGVVTAVLADGGLWESVEEDAGADGAIWDAVEEDVPGAAVWGAVLTT